MVYDKKIPQLALLQSWPNEIEGQCVQALGHLASPIIITVVQTHSKTRHLHIIIIIIIINNQIVVVSSVKVKGNESSNNNVTGFHTGSNIFSNVLLHF